MHPTSKAPINKLAPAQAHKPDIKPEAIDPPRSFRDTKAVTLEPTNFSVAATPAQAEITKNFFSKLQGLKAALGERDDKAATARGKLVADLIDGAGAAAIPSVPFGLVVAAVLTGQGSPQDVDSLLAQALEAAGGKAISPVNFAAACEQVMRQWDGGKTMQSAQLLQHLRTLLAATRESEHATQLRDQLLRSTLVLRQRPEGGESALEALMNGASQEQQAQLTSWVLALPAETPDALVAAMVRGIANVHEKDRSAQATASRGTVALRQQVTALALTAVSDARLTLLVEAASSGRASNGKVTAYDIDLLNTYQQMVTLGVQEGVTPARYACLVTGLRSAWLEADVHSSGSMSYLYGSRTLRSALSAAHKEAARIAFRMPAQIG